MPVQACSLNRNVCNSQCFGNIHGFILLLARRASAKRCGSICKIEPAGNPCKKYQKQLALMASCPSDKAKQVVDGLYVEKSPFFTVTAQMDGVFSEPEAALL